MRVLLFGGTGQVGAEICSLLDEAGVDLVAPGHADFDLTDRKAIVRLLGSQPWDMVINAAAYTNVDGAESDEALAFTINAEAPSMDCSRDRAPRYPADLYFHRLRVRWKKGGALR